MNQRLPTEFLTRMHAATVRARRAEGMLRARLCGFATVGRRVVVARGCRIEGGAAMVVGENVVIQRGSWLVVPGAATGAHQPPRLFIGGGCDIGEACTISAATLVEIGPDVLFGPRVWVTDNNHRFDDPTRPIMSQGWSEGGSVHIGPNCWIGTGAVLVGARGLRVGKGCVVGANSVVTRDVPDFSVVTGSPARIVRQFDSDSAQWQAVDAQ